MFGVYALLLRAADWHRAIRALLSVDRYLHLWMLQYLVVPGARPVVGRNVEVAASLQTRDNTILRHATRIDRRDHERALTARL